MTFNNRIYQYTCSVCKRNIEKLADPTRPDPVRCLITNKCTGILSLSRSRLGTRVKTTPTVEDYYRAKH